MDEKMRILKLLESGKINAEEATKLLEALKESEISERAVIVKKVVNRVGETMESMAALMKEISVTVVEKVKEKTKEATERLKEVTEEVKDEVKKETKKKVRKRAKKKTTGKIKKVKTEVKKGKKK